MGRASHHGSKLLKMADIFVDWMFDGEPRGTYWGLGVIPNGRSALHVTLDRQQVAWQAVLCMLIACSMGA